jgi:type I restriction enzyme M protein
MSNHLTLETHRTYTKRLEASVVQSVLTQLDNLKWHVDEKKSNCNVFQQRAKTVEQKRKLEGRNPDFVLYQEDTDTPIAIIETKRPGKTVRQVLKEAKDKYATKLETPLIFVYNDTYIETQYLWNGHNLKIDGEDVRQFIDHYTAIRFVQEGSEILSAPKHVQYSREQLIKIFKRASNLLREAGLQQGLERFGAFSDILFLKIMDEVCELKLHAGKEPPIPEHARWANFKNKASKPLHAYIKDVVWKEMNKKYGTIFSGVLPIDDPQVLKDIVKELSELNLTSADTDVKGDAFEYFLKNAYQGLSIKDLGEYFTPRNIVRTMVNMVAPKYGEKIYDPFCGTGGFLIESFKYIGVRLKPNKRTERILQEETVYGSEITTNARISKMNMILFGDGHNNIKKEDSFKNPKKGKFDVVLTNPPYSQKTRYGNYYPIPSSNGDVIAVQHCFESLNDNGRCAMLIKEDFLSEGGDIGETRKYILNNAKNFSIVSLPRKLFVPYTPTKTSIIYFEKAGKRKTTFFYVIKNVGQTLSARKKNIKENDLPVMLDAYKSENKANEIDSCVVDNEIIAKTDHSLWVYDYIETYPESSYEMDFLGNWIKERTEVVKPSESPDEEFRILGVNNRIGIFEDDEEEKLFGKDIRQRYKPVKTGDLVYNPHRVNVGSIGLVTEEFNGGYVSGIYVVFYSADKKIPPEYILKLLKSNQYKRVIEAYDTKYGAVRANLTFEQLCRIKIPMLSNDILKKFLEQQDDIMKRKKELENKEKSISKFISNFSGKPKIANAHF